MGVDQYLISSVFLCHLYSSLTQFAMFNFAFLCIFFLWKHDITKTVDATFQICGQEGSY